MTRSPSAAISAPCPSKPRSAQSSFPVSQSRHLRTPALGPATKQPLHSAGCTAAMLRCSDSSYSPHTSSSSRLASRPFARPRCDDSIPWRALTEPLFESGERALRDGLLDREVTLPGVLSREALRGAGEREGTRSDVGA